MGGGVTWQQPEASLLHVHMALYTYLCTALAALPGSGQRRGRFARIGVQRLFPPTSYRLPYLLVAYYNASIQLNVYTTINALSN